jgi:hypothetical protein
MDITSDMRPTMREHDLSEPMVRAIFTGDYNAVLNCGTRTEKALIERGIMHAIESDLTAKGRRILKALKATQPAEPAAAPSEGVIEPAPQATEDHVAAIKPGDLVEAVTFCANPRTIRVRVTRKPERSSTSGTVLVGGEYSHFVTTESIRVIDEPPAVDETPAAAAIEGVIVTHAGVTMGTLPKHADNGDARSAIAALSNGQSLNLAELTDHFEPEEGEDVNGFMVEPRGDGRVAVYWVSGGSIRKRNGGPFGVELQIAANRLRAAGWRIEPKSLFCVFAWRPIGEVSMEISAQLEAEAVARLPKIKAGDLVEAETVSDVPGTIRVRVTGGPQHTPGQFGTVLPDVWGPVTVKTDSVRVVDETPAVPAPARELLHEEISYGIQYREGDGPWKSYIATSAICDEAEADDYIADLQALADPGTELRAVEVRTTRTALPRPDAPKPSDVESGPVAARKIRSGDRVYHLGGVRLVWKVVYQRDSHSLRVHTVPPAGESAAYYAFTFTPSEMTELVSRGPAVDVAGRPVDTTR